MPPPVSSSSHSFDDDVCYALSLIAARTIIPETEERAVTSNLRGVRRGKDVFVCLLANRLRRKCLSSNASFPRRAHGYHRVSTYCSGGRSGKESEETWCPGCDRLHAVQERAASWAKSSLLLGVALQIPVISPETLAHTK